MSRFESDISECAITKESRMFLRMKEKVCMSTTLGSELVVVAWEIVLLGDKAAAGNVTPLIVTWKPTNRRGGLQPAWK